MNKLILIGNGFDLAHQMKTSYNDFILWYLKKCFNKAQVENPYTDPLITVHLQSFFSVSYFNEKGSGPANKLIDHFYSIGLSHITDREVYIKGSLGKVQNPYIVNVHSSLLKKLLISCSSAKWVDIENCFYESLKEILKLQSEKQEALLKPLNESLRHIIHELEEYLSVVNVKKINLDFNRIFCSDVDLDAIPRHSWTITDVDRIMFLNFNYTSTVEEYINVISEDERKRILPINYIHGELKNPKNPMIFGFGDELDEDYRSMELSKSKGFFNYIKSFWYFKTSNYHNLIRYIDSLDFQVIILGHSCGLSDRTMLNMIFEHPNCVSIKIYYYENGNGYNNYTELTEEISRHFKNKIDMRIKMVPFDKSESMPQVTND